jgi:hypothetical protein
MRFIAKPPVAKCFSGRRPVLAGFAEPGKRQISRRYDALPKNATICTKVAFSTGFSAFYP